MSCLPFPFVYFLYQYIYWIFFELVVSIINTCLIECFNYSFGIARSTANYGFRTGACIDAPCAQRAKAPQRTAAGVARGNRLMRDLASCRPSPVMYGVQSKPDVASYAKPNDCAP